MEWLAILGRRGGLVEIGKANGGGSYGGHGDGDGSKWRAAAGGHDQVERDVTVLGDPPCRSASKCDTHLVPWAWVTV